MDFAQKDKKKRQKNPNNLFSQSLVINSKIKLFGINHFPPKVNHLKIPHQHNQPLKNKVKSNQKRLKREKGKWEFI